MCECCQIYIFLIPTWGVPLLWCSFMTIMKKVQLGSCLSAEVPYVCVDLHQESDLHQHFL